MESPSIETKRFSYCSLSHQFASFRFDRQYSLGAHLAFLSTLLIPACSDVPGAITKGTRYYLDVRRLLTWVPNVSERSMKAKQRLYILQLRLLNP